MNGVIHQCSHSSDEKLITSRDESEIFLAVFAYVQALFDKIRPSKLFFLAVDGVAPRAKMNQQRSRRFRTAAEKAEAEAKEAKKEHAELAKVLNDPSIENVKVPVKYFDTNCITPGTEFMEKLSAHLCFFIAKRIEEDPNWRNVKIVFSGPEVPGEGEHKVMEWIRSERSRNDYEPNIRHCLYGLDADLMMLGLLSHEPHFSLLREEVTFGRGKKTTAGSSGLKSADQVRFQLLHLGLMRDYMQSEFGGTLAASLNFQYDFERVLDDFVLLSLFVGNDFLPHLPHLHINENALGLLFDAYKATLPKLDGYLNDCGQIDLKRCAKVLKNIVEFERQVFESECADELMSISASKAAPVKQNTSNLPPITPKQRKLFDDFVLNFLKKENVYFWECDPELVTNHPEDRVFVAGLAKDFMLILEFTEDHSFVIRKCFEDEEEEFIDPQNDDEKWKFTLNTAKIISKYEKRPILSELDSEGFTSAIVKHEEVLWQSWKSRYYADKMEIRETAERDSLIQKYCEGLEWVMAYYYEGVASWSWFFNYHYAPFLSDILEFLGDEIESGSFKDDGCHVGRYKKIKFELGRPFAPFEQLMGVLPSLSSALVPAPLAALMTSVESPILHFFPTEFESDLNGKKNSWEAVVKIPFIDENLLVETLNSKYSLLTETEMKRNRFGDSFTFEYHKSGSSFDWLAPSASFEPLEKSPVKMIKQEIGKPSREALRKGLVPGTLLGLDGPPSFPSLKTLPHSSVLQHLNVQVFPGQPSKAMTLALVVTDEHVNKYKGYPLKVFENETVYFNWPHLIEGRLVAITDGERVYLPTNVNYCLELTPQVLQKYAGQGVHDYEQLIGRIEEIFSSKKGILLAGGVSLLAVLRPFRRLKLDPSGNGAIIKEFDETRVEIIPLQLLVFNLPRVDGRFQGRAAFSSNPVELITRCFKPGDEVISVGSTEISVGFVDGYVQEGQALSVLIKGDEMPPDLRGIVKSSLERNDANFVNGKKVSDALNLPTWLLSKLTSTYQVMYKNSVVNVGFGIKFEAKSRAVPDLARKHGPGRWKYSRKFIGHLEDYVRSFPELISALIKSGPSSDRPNLDLIPKIEEVKLWLKARGYPVGSDLAQPCDRVQVLDILGIEEISVALEKGKLQSALNCGKEMRKLSPCKPETLLTRETAQLYCIQRNESCGRFNYFNAGDRIIWCGDGADGIPFGSFGTILAVFCSNETCSIWLLSDQNLRGIGSDLGGFLPANLKHRGIIAPAHKILVQPVFKKLQGTRADIKVNSNVMKFNDATKTKTKNPENVSNKASKTNAEPVKNQQSAMDLLNNLFKAASIKKSCDGIATRADVNKPVTKTRPVNEPITQAKAVNEHVTKAKNFSRNSNISTNKAPVKSSNLTTSNCTTTIQKRQEEEEEKEKQPIFIKKKLVATSGTIKISYSTKTKTKQIN
jgi:5'-3' exoribonuclease 1